MTVIRLARLGRKKRPFYRVVVTDSRKRRDSDYKEAIGTYDPLGEEKILKLDKERYDYWIKVGAKPSQRVQALAKK